MYSGSLIFTACSALLAATASASGTIEFPVKAKNYAPSNRFKGSSKDSSELSQRDLTLQNSLNLTTSYNYFLTNISIGTPAQEIEVAFDTGSPFLWVFGQNGSYNNATRFDPSKSSTYESLDEDFQALYGAGGVWGEWSTDDIIFEQSGNYSIKDFPFGLIDQYQLAAGVPGLIGLGIGADLGIYNKSYQNVPDAYYEQNITSSPAFSVFFDSDDSGSVIFGGVDKTKFKKPFYGYDISTATSPGQGTYYYQIQLNYLTLDDEEPYKIFGSAVLDTGSPFSQVPPNFVKKVGEKLGLSYYPKYQCYYANKTVDELSKHINGSTTVSFTFGNFEVEVPIRDMLVPGTHIWVDDGPQNATAVALLGASSYVIGDHFFRNAYTVLDSLNRRVYLAHGNKNATIHSNSTNIFALDSNCTNLHAIEGKNASGNPYSYTKLTTIPPAYASSTMKASAVLSSNVAAATTDAASTTTAAAGLGILELLGYSG